MSISKRHIHLVWETSAADSRLIIPYVTFETPKKCFELRKIGIISKTNSQLLSGYTRFLAMSLLCYQLFFLFVLWVCLQSKDFHLYGDDTITREALHILTQCCVQPLNSEGPYTCYTNTLTRVKHEYGDIREPVTLTFVVERLVVYLFY